MAEEKKAVKPKKATTTKAEAKPKVAVKKDASVKKTTTKPAAKKTKTTPENSQLRYKMIEVTAYYLAEKDGFTGSPVEYWIKAELQINSQ